MRWLFHLVLKLCRDEAWLVKMLGNDYMKGIVMASNGVHDITL